METKPYIVTWQIEVDAPSAQAAAQFAKSLQMSSNDDANYFHVEDEEGNTYRYHLIEEPHRKDIH